MFYGKECPHCHESMKGVKKLEKDDKVEFELLEVWHNEKNQKRMGKTKEIEESCGGMFVPAFVDVKKKRAICGQQTYEDLKEWINSK
jgi:glutaredoxin-related protein